ATEGADIDAEDVKAKTQTLMEASMKLGQAMYEAQAAEGGASGEGADDDDNVVDADFEDVSGDDKKKSA
ncbi:MAG: dnaK, partial [Rhizobium sp.]|nr:dnaK [Rhizobium sp.]